MALTVDALTIVSAVMGIAMGVQFQHTSMLSSPMGITIAELPV